MRLVDAAMFAERDEPDEFIRMLMLLHDNTKEAATQDALFELIKAAFNVSIAHTVSLENYLDDLRAGGRVTEAWRAKRYGPTAGDAPESSPKTASGAKVSDERRRNVMELGEHLIAILENPETPVAIHNDLADAMNDLINDASPGIAGDARRNWPQIAERLLSQPEKEGGQRQ